MLAILQGSAQSIVINEVCYSNKNVLHDSDGDSPDWFELYNGSHRSVNLADFAVTDDTAKTACWFFPEYELKPDSFLVVLASDKNIRQDLPFHTDFRIRNMQESLFLLDRNGAVIDAIKPRCVPTDASLARCPDGSGHLMVAKPTPGNSNNRAEEIAVHYHPDTLTVNYPAGFYKTPLSVELSNSHPGNEIRFTLNGDTPDEESPVYRYAIGLEDLTSKENRFAGIPDDGVEPGNKILKANVLRAVVYSNGCPASHEICNTYFIGHGSRYEHKVPVVSLVTDKDNLFDKESGIYVKGKHDNYYQHGGRWERKAHVEIFDSAGTLVIDQDAGIRMHGRGSRHFPQKSFRLYAGAEYGTEYFHYPFFSQKPGLNRFKTMLLRTTNVSGESLIKNELCNSLVQQMNMDYQACQTVVAFVNGEYWGIYNLAERQDRYYIENNYGITNPDLDIIGYNWQIEVEEGSPEAYNQLVETIMNADPVTGDFYDAMKKSIDLDALIDYFSAQMYLANTDWPKSNLELWRINAEPSKWRYFFFDMDETMVWVNYNTLGEYFNEIENYRGFPDFSTLVMKSLLRNPVFKREFQARFSHHLATTFSAARVIGQINRLESIYAPLVPDNIYRWHKPASYVEWQQNIGQLRSFAVQRPLVMAGQLQKELGNPFIVYPVPGCGTVMVTSASRIKRVNIEIYSTSGILMHEHEVTDCLEFEVRVGVNIPPGLYVLRLTTDGISYPFKMILP